MENEDLSGKTPEEEREIRTRVSEQVLDEWWDLKMRKALYQRKGKEYDGGDL